MKAEFHGKLEVVAAYAHREEEVKIEPNVHRIASEQNQYFVLYRCKPFKNAPPSLYLGYAEDREVLQLKDFGADDVIISFEDT